MTTLLMIGVLNDLLLLLHIYVLSLDDNFDDNYENKYFHEL